MTWKTTAGRCIYQSASGINVYQNYIYRWLTLNSNVLQTLIHRRQPAKPALNYIKHLIVAASLQPADCCILGLGGGAVVHALSSYLQKLSLVAVESNAEVIAVARSYFMIDTLKNLTVIHQDANLFLQQSHNQYQHLLVDLFDAYSFPAHCNNHQFFAKCKRLLLPGGVLAVNLANLHEQWPVFEHIRSNFNHCTITLPVKGTANMVILASNEGTITPLLDRLKRSKLVKKLAWNAKWGCVALI